MIGCGRITEKLLLKTEVPLAAGSWRLPTPARPKNLGITMQQAGGSRARRFVEKKEGGRTKLAFCETLPQGT